jgi:hypothetical protein
MKYIQWPKEKTTDYICPWDVHGPVTCIWYIRLITKYVTSTLHTTSTRHRIKAVQDSDLDNHPLSHANATGVVLYYFFLYSGQPQCHNSGHTSIASTSLATRQNVSPLPLSFRPEGKRVPRQQQPQTVTIKPHGDDDDNDGPNDVSDVVWAISNFFFFRSFVIYY